MDALLLQLQLAARNHAQACKSPDCPLEYCSGLKQRMDHITRCTNPACTEAAGDRFACATMQQAYRHFCECPARAKCDICGPFFMLRNMEVSEMAQALIDRWPSQPYRPGQHYLDLHVRRDLEGKLQSFEFYRTGGPCLARLLPDGTWDKGLTLSASARAESLIPFMGEDGYLLHCIDPGKWSHLHGGFIRGNDILILVEPSTGDADIGQPLVPAKIENFPGYPA